MMVSLGPLGVSLKGLVGVSNIAAHQTSMHVVLQMRLRAVVTDAMRTAGTPLPHAPPSLAFASH